MDAYDSHYSGGEDSVSTGTPQPSNQDALIHSPGANKELNAHKRKVSVLERAIVSWINYHLRNGNKDSDVSTVLPA